MNIATIYLLLMLVFTCTISRPLKQAKDGTSRDIDFDENYSRQIQTWLKAGIQACAQGQYNDALQHFQRILDMRPPVKSGLRSYTYSWIANVHCGRRDSSAAFLALRDAANTGYAEWESVERLLRSFHYADTPEAQKIIAAMKQNAAMMKVYDVQLWDNPDISDEIPLRFSDYNSTIAQKLRSEYHLHNLIVDKDGELEKQCAVMTWVHQLWEHSASGFATDYQATEILASVKKGKAFRCHEYAIVLREALQALGFPARIVELGCDGISFGIGKSHFVVEVWNNTLRKWILLDPQNNLLWRSSASTPAIPLNAVEIRLWRISSNTKDSASSRLQAELLPSRWRSTQNFRKDEWLPYFHHLFYPNDNRSNSISPEFLPTTNLLSSLQQPELAYQDGIRTVHFAQRIEQVYVVQNRVHIDLQSFPRSPKERLSQTSSVLVLKLENSMPWFARYTIEVNGRITHQTAPKYEWHLVKGKNTLVVTAFNSAGIAGIPSRIELIYHGKSPQ